MDILFYRICRACKTDGCKFNRKIIANLAKKLKNLSSTESRNIDNWKGLKIELKADPTVKMMGRCGW